MSTGNLLQTCNFSVDLGKALRRFFQANRYITRFNRIAKPIKDILCLPVNSNVVWKNKMCTQLESVFLKKLFCTDSLKVRRVHTVHLNSHNKE